MHIHMHNDCITYMNSSRTELQSILYYTCILYIHDLRLNQCDYISVRSYIHTQRRIIYEIFVQLINIT